ncbi:MAG TPA: cupredoxin domain-containing protein [Blastocatellia bacterium]|nr:cupredoxin domain-containing protein [Blastocatellia bacterium]
MSHSVITSLLVLLSISVFGMGAVAQEGSRAVTIKGQVVCPLCWFEADRKVKPYGSEDDIKCAVNCAKSGKSQAIVVVGKEQTALYLLDKGSLKRDGKDWLDYIGKDVRASGTVRVAGDKNYLVVDSIELVQGDSDVQSATVILTANGYEPASLNLKVNVAARITFVRKAEKTCGTELAVPEFDINRPLPLNQPVVVELTPRKTGEFAFTCGMGMLRGKLVVQ